MPTTLATPSPNNASMRFKETYVSDGLNRKSLGSFPAGVVRGGLLETAGAGLNVNISPDPNTGDSVYVFTNVNGRQITFRDSGVRTLNLAAVASTTVFVCLFIDYSTGGPTVVEWRAYTQAEIDALPEGPFVVIVGQAVVPGAGPIDAVDVTPTGLRQAWADASKGVRPWLQIVRNGDFRAGFAAGAPVGEEIPYMNHATTVGSATVAVSGTNARSGGKSLEWVSGATGTTLVTGTGQAGSVNIPRELIPVKPGQRVHVSLYIAGATVPASSSAALAVVVLDEAGAFVEAVAFAEDTTSTGTFGYSRYEAVGKVTTAGFLDWNLILRVTGAGPGSYFVDDMRIYLEPDGDVATEDVGAEAIPERYAERAAEFALVPHGGAVADLDERANKTVSTKHDTVTGGVAELETRQADGTEFLWKLLGQLDFTGLAATTAQVTNTKIDDHVLIYESPADASTVVKTRLYAKNVATGVEGGFEVTVNAFFAGSGTARTRPVRHGWTRPGMARTARVRRRPRFCSARRSSASPSSGSITAASTGM